MADAEDSPLDAAQRDIVALFADMQSTFFKRLVSEATESVQRRRLQMPASRGLEIDAASAIWQVPIRHHESTSANDFFIAAAVAAMA